MDLQRIAGVEPPVDEAAVQEEVAAYLGGVELRREPWRITSLGQADWAMRRVAECRALAERYDGEVRLWQAARSKIVGAADWFEDRLKEWAIAERTEANKTIRTAHGTVPTRKSKPKITVVDEGAAIAWAKTACPGAVKVVESFLVSVADGTGAYIANVPVGWVATNKDTGEVERIPSIDPPDSILIAERLAAVKERMGDRWLVEVETQPAVVDADGRPVPGLDVTPGRITATVTPLGI